MNLEEMEAVTDLGDVARIAAQIATEAERGFVNRQAQVPEALLARLDAALLRCKEGLLAHYIFE